MKFGNLIFDNVSEKPELLAGVVTQFISKNELGGILVSEIDPSLSDTAAFCEKYQVVSEQSANCVIIEAKRADRIWYVACIVLANTRADVNGIVRKYIDAKKTSFASMDDAVRMTGMEYGAINPIGLPSDWQILIDTAVYNAPNVIIGSGIRKSKLLVPGSLLATIPNAVVLDIVKAN